MRSAVGIDTAAFRFRARFVEAGAGAQLGAHRDTCRYDDVEVHTVRGLVPGDAWSKELPGSKDLIGDWVTLKCGNYNVVTKRCG